MAMYVVIYSAESALAHGKQDFKRDTSWDFLFNQKYSSLVASRTDPRSTSGKETVSTCSSNPLSSLVQLTMNEDHLLSHLAHGAVLVSEAVRAPGAIVASVSTTKKIWAIGRK